MGQAFRKLFDAFFGNSEMRVWRSLKSFSPFDVLEEHPFPFHVDFFLFGVLLIVSFV
jgi:hypothetical protein